MDKKNILIVEDERLIAMEIAARLERLGYNVCYDATDAEETFRQIEIFRPDIILMDIRISGDLDGIETAKKIQELVNIPIVYITAYSDNATLNRAKETMPYGYLTKPIQENDLRIVLEMTFYKIQVEKELKFAQLKLEESELRNRTLLNALPDLIFQVTFDGRILDYSSQAESLLLLPPEQFLNKDIQSFLPKNIAVMAKKAIGNAIKNNNFEVFTYDLNLNSQIHNFEARAVRLNEKEAVVIVRNITEINRARIKLMDNEERHRILVEKTGTIVYDLNLDTLSVYREGAIEEVLGYTREEFCSLSYAQYLDLIHDKDRLDTVNAADFSIKNGGNYSLQYRLQHKNGTYLYIEDIGIVQNNTENQPKRMLGAIKNINKRKLAEIELLKERELFSEGPVIITVMEPVSGWPLKYVSNNVTKILGYSRQELLLKNFRYAEIIHLKDFERVTKAIQYHITNHKEIYELSYRIKKKDGAWLWIYDYGVLIRDDYGKLIEIRGYMFDQTQLKLTMQELEASEIKYRTVAKYNSNWEYWISMEGKFIYISPSVENISGYKPEEFHNKPKLLEDIIYSDDRILWLDHKRNSMVVKDKNEPINLKFRIITKNGNIRWIQHTCRQIFENDHCIGIRASNRDVTEEVETKRKLITNTIEVEESERNRYSRELHDGLGPLLATIKLYFQWLVETKDKNKVKLLTEKGLLNIERAIRTVREVSHGLSPLYIMNEGFVKAMCNFVSDLNLSQEVKFTFDSNIQARINSILEITLYRITTELINNTIKYAQANKVDIVSNHIIDRKVIGLSYVDDGIGFDFDKEVAAGMGLGLSNIMSRVESLRGSFKIDSNYAYGTMIYIELPLTDY